MNHTDRFGFVRRWLLVLLGLLVRHFHQIVYHTRQVPNGEVRNPRSPMDVVCNQLQVELGLFSEIKMRTCWCLIVFYYTSSSWEIHETSALIRVSALFNRLLKGWVFLEISCKKNFTIETVL